MSEGALHRLDDAALRAWPLPAPRPDGDKKNRGSVTLVAGMRETPGAALLAARAALRAGAGRVVVATGVSTAAALALAQPELRVIGLRETDDGTPDPAEAPRLAHLAERSDVLLVGPGWIDERASTALARALLAVFSGVPTLLDAAAMGAVLDDPTQRAPLLVTPHAGEMAHLLHRPMHEVRADAAGCARALAQRCNAVVALKGATTHLAQPDGEVWRHETCEIGLATAGSGDVLAGLVAGLAARGATLAQAAAWAVGVHAHAGARLARRTGRLGYLACEVADEIPAAIEGIGAT